MKVGMRSPSIKRSVSARTTGRISRSMKKIVNPLYGKKGMGYIKNPEKAVKNAIYHKTTVDVFSGEKSRTGSSGARDARSPLQFKDNTKSSEHSTPIERKPILGKGVKLFVLFAVILLICLYIGARL